MMLFFLSGSGWNILFPLEIGQNDAIVIRIATYLVGGVMVSTGRA